MPGKKSQTKGKPTTDMQRDEMGRPVTPKQKAESLRGIQQSVDYPGRPKMKSGGTAGKSSKFAKPKMKMGGSCGTPKSLGKRK